jgi:Ca-activated chloride channel family protein
MRRRHGFAFATLVLVGIAIVCAPGRLAVARVSMLDPGQQPVFSARTTSVAVDVLVTQNGQPLHGLRTSDFEVRDNGVLQQVDLVTEGRLSVDVILAFDTSDSVAGTRLGQLRSASGLLLDETKKGDRAALVTFSDTVRLPSMWTPDVGTVRSALEAVRAQGGTALVDGVYLALAVGETSAGRGLAIVFSDGVDTSSWLSEEAVLQVARRSGLVVYAVSAIDSGKPPSFLREVCAATGGRLIEDESTWNLSSVFLDVIEEFRQRYLVSFTPRGVARDGWHRLDVRVKRPKAVVNARAGYYGGP